MPTEKQSRWSRFLDFILRRKSKSTVTQQTTPAGPATRPDTSSGNADYGAVQPRASGHTYERASAQFEDSQRQPPLMPDDPGDKRAAKMAGKAPQIAQPPPDVPLDLGPAPAPPSTYSSLSAGSTTSGGSDLDNRSGQRSVTTTEAGSAMSLDDDEKPQVASEYAQLPGAIARGDDAENTEHTDYYNQGITPAPPEDAGGDAAADAGSDMDTKPPNRP